VFAVRPASPDFFIANCFPVLDKAFDRLNVPIHLQAIVLIT